MNRWMGRCVDGLFTITAERERKSEGGERERMVVTAGLNRYCFAVFTLG